MFFDETQIGTKKDVFSLEALIEWLEKRPGDKEYCFFDTGGCMLHQYFEYAKVDAPQVGGMTYRTSSGDKVPLPLDFRLAARGYPRTFSGALLRARQALAQRSA